MATPSEVYYTLGDAIATHLGVDFLTETPKKGRPKATATGMSLSPPIVFPPESLRYGSGGRLDFILTVTAPNTHDLLQTLDSVVKWIKENVDSLGFSLNLTELGFSLNLTEANPYFEGDTTSPNIIGYAFEVRVNL